MDVEIIQRRKAVVLTNNTEWVASGRDLIRYYTAWFKKMGSISYVYIAWTIHGMWM